ncbi:MAG: DNA-directed RNA polymerase subunit beta [Synergistaceae bacterium]|nr:DNA-directed RNA polymerase subunit beta [Synergistaceae bacterium]
MQNTRAQSKTPPSGRAYMKRRNFGTAQRQMPLPSLVEVQQNSYDWFFQDKVPTDERVCQGLQELFLDMFPISSPDGTYSLEFVKYHIDDKPSISQEEAREKDRTWSRRLKATFRLVNVHSPKEIQEEELFVSDIPCMTARGTFIINGSERVIVNQLSRSAGVYFSADLSTPGSETYTAKLIPERGAWIEFDLTSSGAIMIKIDTKKKIPVTVLLRVLGVESTEELLKLFGGEVVTRELNEDIIGSLIAEEILGIDETPDINKYTRISREIFDVLTKHGRTNVQVYDIPSPIAATLEADKTTTIDEAKIELFRRLRPNEPHRIENARNYIDGFFFDKDRYNLGRVGRYKLNRRLGMDLPDSMRSLTVKDVCVILSKLFDLRDGMETMDDIDHLGNRRVRAVGELLYQQLRVGFVKMQRTAIDRWTTSAANHADYRPSTFITVRPITTALREFFNSSQLSQFMDQTNPLAELTHRRRLSALGPGGLSRERAGFEARDVHHTHYARVCPIETPEGPNIGLVTSLASYAKLNDYGFLVTPRRKVENGYLTTQIDYLSADEEDNFYVGRADLPMTEDGKVLPSPTGKIYARRGDNTIEIFPEELDYIDVAPKQIVSVSTSLIPFLEHDDANRALMGSNMQRQGVPLVFPDSPMVGTGVEHKLAHDSGSCVVSVDGGIVKYVDANRIEVEEDSGETRVYKMLKFSRSNQGTLVHQRPLVYHGQRIEADEVIADGQACDEGELALGRNVLVAFVSWEGYNFEDAILLSRRLVKEDFYTSIHIQEYQTDIRSITKLGNEEFTRDIPNVGQDMLQNLDVDGIVRIGAVVGPGDILVGKVTPKGESDETPEEKLLRAIFGEKAKDVRDTSLRVPHGEGGTVVSIRRQTKKDTPELEAGVLERVKVYVAQFRKITEGDKMAGRHGNKGVVSRIMAEEDMPYLSDGTPVDVVLNPLGVPSRMNLGQVLETMLGFVALNRGYKVSTPVFDSAQEKDILDDIKWIKETRFNHKEVWRGTHRIAVLNENEGKEALERYSKDPRYTIVDEMRDDCKLTIYDGRTGEPMANQVMVGVMYMLKLNHLVDDKMHARSIGPYSLITQQPLGGKTQFGGQRFGEMEVWALEGYGASHVLQEMLTIKSDDIRGRLKTYEKIVKGENLSTPGVPESFRVLIKELQGLALDVDVQFADGSFGPLQTATEEERLLLELELKKKAAQEAQEGAFGEDSSSSEKEEGLDEIDPEFAEALQEEANLDADSDDTQVVTEETAMSVDTTTEEGN